MIARFVISFHSKFPTSSHFALIVLALSIDALLAIVDLYCIATSSMFAILSNGSSPPSSDPSCLAFFAIYSRAVLVFGAAVNFKPIGKPSRPLEH
jgi:hypothetical protein